MLTVVATILAKPGFELQVKAELEKLVAPTRRESGCINYDMHQGIDNPCCFVFYENWTSKAALDVHLNQPHLVAWRAFEHESGALAMPVKIELFEMVSEAV